jgi:hypothetical protein
VCWLLLPLLTPLLLSLTLQLGAPPLLLLLLLLLLALLLLALLFTLLLTLPFQLTLPVLLLLLLLKLTLLLQFTLPVLLLLLLLSLSRHLRLTPLRVIFHRHCNVETRSVVVEFSSNGMPSSKWRQIELARDAVVGAARKLAARHLLLLPVKVRCEPRGGVNVLTTTTTVTRRARRARTPRSKTFRDKNEDDNELASETLPRVAQSR